MREVPYRLIVLPHVPQPPLRAQVHQHNQQAVEHWQEDIQRDQQNVATLNFDADGRPLVQRPPEGGQIDDYRHNQDELQAGVGEREQPAGVEEPAEKKCLHY